MLHGIAAALLIGLGWFLIQPVQGDLAFWTPAFGSLLFVASIAIAGGCFAWWRFGSRRALIAGDAVALFQIAFVSLLLIFLPVMLVAGVLLLVGVGGARAADATTTRVTSPPTRVHPIAILAAITLAVILTIETFGFVLGDVAPFVDYGVSEVVVTGSIWLAILFWLDGRPGALLGVSLALVYVSVQRLADVATFTGYPLFIQLELLLSFGASAIVGLATGRAVWRRALIARLASGAVAVLFVIGFFTVAVVAPIALVLAVLIELPGKWTNPVPIDRASSDEPTVSVA